MNLSGIFNTIILLGAIQGFIISILLLFSKNNKLANRLLATLIFLMALASFNLYGHHVNWFNVGLIRFLAELIPMVIIMPFGPLIFFYVKSFATPEFKLDKSVHYHFYPTLIDFIPTLVVISYFIGTYSKLVTPDPKPWGNFIDYFNVYADIPRWGSLTIYIVLSLKYLLKKPQYAISTNSFDWLKILINVFLAFQILWLVYLIPYVIPAYTNKIVDNLGWYPIYIPLTILIYWLGIKGYLAGYNHELSPKKTVDINSLLSSQELIKVVNLLRATIEDEKIYRNPNLNLQSLAQQIGYSPKIISAVLNQHLQKSFNEYINEHRIAEFKMKFLGLDFDHFTITGLALACGFNSQATFQRAFKESTGLSPSEFRKSKDNKLDNSSQIMI